MGAHIATDLPEETVQSFFWVDSYRSILKRNVANRIKDKPEDFPPGGGITQVNQEAFQSLEQDTRQWLINEKGIDYPKGKAKEKFEERVGDMLAGILAHLLKK